VKTLENLLFQKPDHGLAHGFADVQAGSFAGLRVPVWGDWSQREFETCDLGAGCFFAGTGLFGFAVIQYWH
jgi:hypothetical protein